MTEADSCNSIYEDHLMCMQHEAGHFLVGYMLGVLPRRYKVPSVEDLYCRTSLVVGRWNLLALNFLEKLVLIPCQIETSPKGSLINRLLTKFACVTLGGLVAEHLLFGYSDLLHSDVQKLDRVLKWLGFTEDEVDFEQRQAAEATALILSSQSEALPRLAEAMALGRSVGVCIDTIEHTLKLEQ